MASHQVNFFELAAQNANRTIGLKISGQRHWLLRGLNHSDYLTGTNQNAINALTPASKVGKLGRNNRRKQ